MTLRKRRSQRARELYRPSNTANTARSSKTRQVHLEGVKQRLLRQSAALGDDQAASLSVENDRGVETQPTLSSLTSGVWRPRRSISVAIWSSALRRATSRRSAKASKSAMPIRR